MNKLVPMVVFFLSLAGPLLAAEPLTLAEALATAGRNHPQIEEAAAALSAAQARIGQARANYWPQVNLAADWSKGDTYLTALGAIRETEFSSTAVVVRQNIYDFGRTAGSAAAARGAREAADEGLALTRQDVAFRLKAAWFLALAAEQQVGASRQTLAAREKLARQAAEFFAQGIRSRVEVARTESALFAGKSLLIRAENNREIARLELAQAMGMESLGDRPLAASETAAAGVPADVAALREEALAARKELKRLAALKESATGSLHSAWSGHLPTLSGIASYGDAGQSALPEGEVWTVGVSVSLPVFSGFATQAQVREASAALEGISAQQRSLRIQVVKEVESAWLGVREAEARLEASSKEAIAAQESQRLAMERYREGVGTTIDAVDAQAQALNAETARIQAGYDREIALARLDRALGR
ncbi:MAG: TolC family protein [Thermodesulfobacteriota bacterium]